MKKYPRKILATAAWASICATLPAFADEPVVDIKQAMHREGIVDGIGTTRIIVDGAGTDKYDKVVTDTLDFWVLVSGRRPENARGFSRLDLRAAFVTTTFNSPPYGDRAHKLTVPYVEPRAVSTDLPYSPVERCNAELARRPGALRETFLKEGGIVRADQAYDISATATWELIPGGVGFKENYYRDFRSAARADAIIECRPLLRPKARTEVHTQGAPKQPGQKMEPTLENVSFKAEPYQIETVAGQQCPTRIRLYGFVQVRRAFAGKLVFFGPYFLSPVTNLAFSEAGQRTVLGDYPVKWGNLDAKAGKGLMAQLVLLKMNVANAENKVLETVDRGIQLNCRPTRTP
jgi:hypothetical protein